MAKCKKKECYEEVPPELEMRGFVYHSKGCAPWAHLEGGYDMKSTRKPRISTSVARTAPSAPSKPFAIRRGFIPPPRKSESVVTKEISTGETVRSTQLTKETSEPVGLTSSAESTPPKPSPEETSDEKKSVESGESGTLVTGSSTALTKSDAVSPEILPAESAKTLIDLQQESLASLSLINDSAKHLFDLMKDIRKDVEADVPAATRRVNPMHINAACNCARSINGLLKLKLDVLKFQKGAK